MVNSASSKNQLNFSEKKETDSRKTKKNLHFFSADSMSNPYTKDARKKTQFSGINYFKEAHF